jgi:hypothetical protein
MAKLYAGPIRQLNPFLLRNALTQGSTTDFTDAADQRRSSVDVRRIREDPRFI